MRTLSGRKLKTIRAATKRDAFMLDGVEITREHATHLLMEHYEHVMGRKPMLNTLMPIIAWRDTATKETPVQTRGGLYWHELVPIK